MATVSFIASQTVSTWFFLSLLKTPYKKVIFCQISISKENFTLIRTNIKKGSIPNPLPDKLLQYFLYSSFVKEPTGNFSLYDSL